MDKRIARIIFIALVLVVTACDKKPDPIVNLDDIYFINEYSEARDPAADLALAITEAESSGRHILMEIGGEWCVWCHILDDFVESHPDVADAIKANFVFIKINYSEDNENQTFLGQFPEIPGYPHLFVLNQQGEFIHSQGTLELEKGESYNEKVFLAFLERWGPKA